jgi:FMN phosphatase YigB (HAD superfamily)
MKHLMIRDLVTDIDGTVLPFPDWYVPAMMRALAYIASVLGVSPEELMRALARNFIRARTHECAYPFVGPYFASLWNGTHEQFVEQVTKPFFTIYEQQCSRYLAAYTGVTKTFSECDRLGIGVHALTDAPLFASLMKLQIAGLQGAFQAIYGMSVYEPDAADIWNPLDYAFCRARWQRAMSFGNQFFAGVHIESLPFGSEKPETGGFKQIITRANIDLRHTAMIGDNRAKDGGVAKAMNAAFYWARYGSYDYVPPQYKEVLEALRPPHPPVNASELTEPPVAQTLATYDGIIPILHRYRRQQFLNSGMRGVQ